MASSKIRRICMYIIEKGWCLLVGISNEGQCYPGQQVDNYIEGKNLN